MGSPSPGMAAPKKNVTPQQRGAYGNSSSERGSVVTGLFWKRPSKFSGKHGAVGQGLPAESVPGIPTAAAQAGVRGAPHCMGTGWLGSHAVPGFPGSCFDSHLVREGRGRGCSLLGVWTLNSSISPKLQALGLRNPRPDLPPGVRVPPTQRGAPDLPKVRDLGGWVPSHHSLGYLHPSRRHLQIQTFRGVLDPAFPRKP